jgi:hypothetical protein
MGGHLGLITLAFNNVWLVHCEDDIMSQKIPIFELHISMSNTKSLFSRGQETTVLVF